MKLHIDVLFLFDRPLSKPLILDESHVHQATIPVNQRLTVKFYQDGPCHLAVLHFDDRPVLWETMVADVTQYITDLQQDAPFLDFLIEYAEAEKLQKHDS